mmetsp:Transcript_14828/g.38586  ORF Transcript_14828/g.38586 Transcript_14828/m.38586 type:complete len:332 (-) Transcript_14828:127-1122(-)
MTTTMLGWTRVWRSRPMPDSARPAARVCPRLRPSGSPWPSACVRALGCSRAAWRPTVRAALPSPSPASPASSTSSAAAPPGQPLGALRALRAAAGQASRRRSAGRGSQAARASCHPRRPHLPSHPLRRVQRRRRPLLSAQRQPWHCHAPGRGRGRGLGREVVPTHGAQRQRTVGRLLPARRRSRRALAHRAAQWQRSCRHPPARDDIRRAAVATYRVNVRRYDTTGIVPLSSMYTYRRFVIILVAHCSARKSHILLYIYAMNLAGRARGLARHRGSMAGRLLEHAVWRPFTTKDCITSPRLAARLRGQRRHRCRRPARCARRPSRRPACWR